MRDKVTLEAEEAIHVQRIRELFFNRLRSLVAGRLSEKGED
jgi:hypothetical protein